MYGWRNVPIKKKKLPIGLSTLFCINVFVSNDTIPNLSWCYYDQNWIPRMAWYSPASVTVGRCCCRCKIHFDFHWSLWWLIMHKKLLCRKAKSDHQITNSKSCQERKSQRGAFSRKHVKIYVGWQQLLRKALRPAREIRGCYSSS